MFALPICVASMPLSTQASTSSGSEMRSFLGRWNGLMAGFNSVKERLHPNRERRWTHDLIL
eukprot:6196665-Pleurochrysis_carterae.AAC.1